MTLTEQVADVLTAADIEVVPDFADDRDLPQAVVHDLGASEPLEIQVAIGRIHSSAADFEQSAVQAATRVFDAIAGVGVIDYMGMYWFEPRDGGEPEYCGLLFNFESEAV